MAMELIHPLTDMSTKNLPGAGKVRYERKVDNLAAIYEPIVQRTWGPWRFTTLWASTAYYRNSFNFHLNLRGF
jgi:hypothetical protein